MTHKPWHSTVLAASLLLIGVAAGSALTRPIVGVVEPTAQGASIPPPAASAPWLKGTLEEKVAQLERHLRGLDQAMAEIGYRYGELLVAGKQRNWAYAKYQTEKIDLSLRLALERRPKRAESSRPFLEKDLPTVFRAIDRQDGAEMDAALVRLHDSCVRCHQAENVLYFRDAVERIRTKSLRVAE